MTEFRSHAGIAGMKGLLRPYITVSRQERNPREKATSRRRKGKFEAEKSRRTGIRE
jgi:hypothetical protein